jgi:hypothetical protein
MEDRRRLWDYDNEIKTAEDIRKRAAIIEDGLPDWAEHLRMIAVACEFKARMILAWESQPISLEAKLAFAEKNMRKVARKNRPRSQH